ncbi:Hint domain-containing protein [Thalassovita sp.]|uniref:Hint domain-containing protein n=1 Tax=Thalassovita sp. TaxID=1979401 RepID=UPI0029DE8376|nr:Hint domain-containing protein [Thalassovita sp.]
MADLVLNWGILGGGTSVTNTTVDTGGVNVNVGFAAVDEGAEAYAMTTDTYVAPGEGFDANSSLKLLGDGGEGGVDTTSVTTLDFASGDAAYSDEVQNVSFRVSDIDAGTDPNTVHGSSMLDQVTIRAFDAAGNPVAVTFTTGGAVSASGETLAGGGSSYEPTDADASVLVEIEGPVARIEIEYANGGDGAQRVYVGDVHFSTIDSDPERDGIVMGTEGDDVIDLVYDGDPDGDFVDATDNIFPGNDPNDDIIYGYGGDDTITGLDGEDTIYGGQGSDVIEGGDNRDVIYGDDATPTASDLPDLGYPGLYGSDADPDNNRDYIDGGDGADRIFGGDDADTILGGLGSDYLDGGIDADQINGGSGNDTIIGGEGSDTIMAGSGDDLVYAGLDPSYPDAVNIPDDRDLVPDNGRDLVHGESGNDTIYGADDDDTLYGDAGNDYLDGQIDEDHLIGGNGDDTLIGGAGGDTLVGGSGTDVIDGGDDRDHIIGINAGEHVDGGDGGDDWDTLYLTGGRARVASRVTDSDGNGWDGTIEYLDNAGNVTGTATFENIEEIVPCFTPGTLIATPRGAVPVQDLCAGDKVLTRDNGVQEIRWVGAKELSGLELVHSAHLKPVLIRAGALGNGLPERDMMVSPNHRVLVTGDKTALYFEEREVLAAAKHLVGMDGIQTVTPMGTTYIHFMFDHHEVVLSDGAWTESFQPGDYTLNGIGEDQRQEILELFPELATQTGLGGYTSARRSLKGFEARLLHRS